MAGPWVTVVPIALAGATAIALVRPAWLRERQPGLALIQRLGILLVTAPVLVLLLIGAASLPAIFESAGPMPLSPDRLAEKATVHLTLYLVVPVIGLLLVLGPRGLARTAKQHLVPGEGRPREIAHALGWTAGATAAIVAAVSVAWGLGRAHDGGLLSAGGAQVVFSNTTATVALLLAGVAAVAEEMLFRGVLLQQFRRWSGDLLAVGGQAVLFGLIHAGYGSGIHVVAAIVFGVAMGLITIQRGLLPAVGVHFLVNVAILGIWTQQMPLVGFTLVALVALTLATWRLLRSADAPVQADVSPS